MAIDETGFAIGAASEFVIAAFDLPLSKVVIAGLVAVVGVEGLTSICDWRVVTPGRSSQARAIIAQSAINIEAVRMWVERCMRDG